MRFLYQYILFFSCIFLFSCKNVKQGQESRNFTATFYIDSIQKQNLADISTLVNFDNRLDSLSIIREAKTNSLIIQDTLYKWSHFNKSFLRYFDNKNSLFAIDGSALGEIELEANNPEFYIETFPSDNQSLLYIDAINELVSYKSNPDGSLSKDWSISLKNSVSLHSHHMSSKENELILLFTDKENSNVIIQTVDLIQGEVVQSKMIETGSMKRIHYLDRNLIAFSDYLRLVIVNVDNNSRDTIPITSRIQDIIALNNEIYYSYKDTVFQSVFLDTSNIKNSRLLVGEEYKIGSMAKVDNQIAIPYYQLNPSDTTNMSNLLLSQGIFIYNRSSQSMVKVEFPYRENFHKLLYLEGRLYVIYGQKVFQISGLGF